MEEDAILADQAMSTPERSHLFDRPGFFPHDHPRTSNSALKLGSFRRFSAPRAKFDGRCNRTDPLSEAARAFPRISGCRKGRAIEISLPVVAGLGVLQGLTEFLPVSSSGHLRLAEYSIGGITQPLALELALHIGTLGAVLVYHRKDLLAQMLSLKPEGDPERRREILHIVLASIPTALLGLGLKKAGVEHLGPRVVAGCLLATAALNESTRHTLGGRSELTPAKAVAIGIVQGVAVLPGISRSGSTIAAGMALGLDPIRAASFSFLCSIPAVGGATLLLLKDMLEGAAPLGPTQVAVGVGVSFLVGMACLEFLMRQLREGSFRPWAVYCLVLALAVLASGMGRDVP